MKSVKPKVQSALNASKMKKAASKAVSCKANKATVK